MAAPRFAHRNLPQLLLQARELVLARFRPLLAANGLTEQQWRIVRALAEHGPMEPNQIVRRCGISSPSLAGILARMEELGHVRRSRLDHDQRRQLISPSAAVLRTAAAMAPRIDAHYAALEAELGAPALRALHDALDHVVERLGGEPGRAAPPTTAARTGRSPRPAASRRSGG